jgi:hypothetical protein
MGKPDDMPWDGRAPVDVRLLRTRDHVGHRLEAPGAGFATNDFTVHSNQ